MAKLRSMRTPEHSAATVKSVKARHGEDFYKRIGAIGGAKSRGGGFTDKALASRAGKIGGRMSRRLKP